MSAIQTLRSNWKLPDDLSDADAVTFVAEQQGVDPAFALRHFGLNTPTAVEPGETEYEQMGALGKAWDTAKQVGKQFGAGYGDAAGMLHGAAEYFSPEGSSFNDAARSGKEYWERHGTSGLTAPFVDEPGMAEDWNPDLEGRGVLARSFARGSRAAVPSLYAMGAGLAGGPVVGGATSFGLFGGSSAQSTLDDAREAGIPEEEASEAALINMMIEGGGETVANLLGVRFIRGAVMGRLTDAYKKEGLGGAIKLAKDPSWVPTFAKQWAANTAVQTATEAGQEYGTTKVRNIYDISDDNPWESAQAGAEGGFGLSLLLGPFGASGFYRGSKIREQAGEILENRGADPQQREIAAQIIAGELKRDGIDGTEVDTWLAAREEGFIQDRDAVLAEQKGQDTARQPETIYSPDQILEAAQTRIADLSQPIERKVIKDEQGNLVREDAPATAERKLEMQYIEQLLGEGVEGIQKLSEHLKMPITQPAVPKVGGDVDINTLADKDEARQIRVMLGEKERTARVTRISKANATRINHIAEKLFGKKVRWFENDTTSNTWQDGYVDLNDTNTINLSVDAMSAHHLVVFGHELYHAMKKTNADIANRFAASVGLNLREGAMGDYAKYYQDPSLSKDGLREELEADLLGNHGMTKKNLEKFFRSIENPTMLGQAVEMVMDFIDGLNASMTKFAGQRGTKDAGFTQSDQALAQGAIKEIRKAAHDALRDYSNAVRPTNPALAKQIDTTIRDRIERMTGIQGDSYRDLAGIGRDEVGGKKVTPTSYFQDAFPAQGAKPEKKPAAPNAKQPPVTAVAPDGTQITKDYVKKLGQQLLASGKMTPRDFNDFHTATAQLSARDKYDVLAAQGLIPKRQETTDGTKTTQAEQAKTEGPKPAEGPNVKSSVGRQEDIRESKTRAKELQPIERGKTVEQSAPLSESQWASVREIALEELADADRSRALAAETQYLSDIERANRDSERLKEVATRVLARMPTSVLSTVRFLQGAQKPTIKGSGKNGKIRVHDVARFLRSRYLKSAADISTEQGVERAARALVHEALHSLSQDGNAVGWYDRKVKEALAVSSLAHPEILTDPSASFHFRVIAAVTSNGQAVRDNFMLTNDIYKVWKETGVLPVEFDGGGSKANAMRIAFGKVNKLVQDIGIEATERELMTMRTVREIQEEFGLKISGENKDTLVPTAVGMGGPKIGNFFANLSGYFDSPTMDLWFMRTIGRMTGGILKTKEGLVDHLNNLLEILPATGSVHGIPVAIMRAEIAKYSALPLDQRLDPEVTIKTLKNTSVYSRAQHSKFAQPDANGKTYTDKSPANENSRALISNLAGLVEIPEGGGHRNQLRSVVYRTLELLKQQGIDLTAADLQAVLWYHEKNLYGKLGDISESAKPWDYASAARFAVGREYGLVNVGSSKRAGSVRKGQSEVSGDVSGRVGGAVQKNDEQGKGKGRVKKSIARVIFEVAPDPNNANLTQRWNSLSNEAKLEISQSVASRILPRILQHFGTTGELRPQVGSYLEFTNPSFAALVKDGAMATAIAKMAGHVLSQDSMMVVGKKYFPGAKRVDAVRVKLGDANPETIYNLLREIEVAGDRPVGGQTTVDGEMVILNYSDTPVAQLAKLVESKLGGQYYVKTDQVWSAFPENKDYGYANSDRRGVGSEVRQDKLAGRRQFADRTRTEAASLIEQELTARERTGPDAGSVRRSGSRNEGDGRGVPQGNVQGYGQAREGAVSAQGVHYSRQERTSLDSKYYGTGLSGAERRRVMDAEDARLRQRIHFYVAKDGAVQPESGVGSYRHEVQLNNLYDANASKEIQQQVAGKLVDGWPVRPGSPEAKNAFESAVLDAGYDGYVSDFGKQRAAVLMGPHTVDVAPVKQADRKFSKGRSALGFYSQLSEAVDAAKINAQPATQWQAWLNANAAKLGVKKDEIQWSGVTDWLDMQGKRKVTKDEISAFLEQGGVQVQEVTLADRGTWTAADSARLDELEMMERSEGLSDSQEAEMGALITRENAATQDGESTPQTLPKYGGWRTKPEGENYREVLLTLPGAARTWEQARDDVVRKWPGADGKAYAEISDAKRAAFDRMFGDETSFRHAAKKDATPANAYRSSHWDQPNVLAHIRLDDRTDAEGNKVLFVQEVQSDWGQEGRDKGFASSETKRIAGEAVSTPADYGDWRVIWEDGTFSGGLNEASARELAAAGKSDARAGTPPAPFVTDTKAWSGLAIKRIITLATEGGYDKVAFVSGEQAADVFGLDKKVSELLYNKGTQSLRATDMSGDDFINRKVTPEELPDVIGKEMADRILSSEGNFVQLSGDGLKVEAKGMRAFYDQIVPQVANDVLKKLGGGKVGPIAIPHKGRAGKAMREEDIVRQRNEGSLTDQLGFDITPAMREKVQTEGQTLFSKVRGTLPPAWQGPNGTINDNVRIDTLTKSLAKGGLGLFESATDKLRRSGSQPLIALAEKVDRYFDQAEARLGWINGMVRNGVQVAGKNRKKNMAAFKDFWTHHDNGRKAEAQAVLNANPEIAPLVTAVMDTFDQIGTINQTVKTPFGNGMKVYDSKLKAYRTIGKIKRGEFWPRAMREEVQAVLQNPSSNLKLWEEMTDALIDGGHIKTRDEALGYLKSYFNPETSNDYFAGIEKARGEKLPEMFYDYSFDTFQRYANKWSTRISQVEQFGQVTNPNTQRDAFSEAQAQTLDFRTQSYIGALADRVYSRQHPDVYSNLLSHLNLLATGLQLGNPATAALNVIGGTSLNIQMFGLRRTVAAFKEMMSDWSNINKMGTELGILNKDVLNILRDNEMNNNGVFDANTTVNRALSKFAETTMKWGGYTPMEHIIRSTAMLAARAQLVEAVKVWNTQPNSLNAKKFDRMVRANRLDKQQLLIENGQGPETARYLRLMVNLPQGSYRVDQTPIYVDTPTGRFVFKYQKFATQVTRMFWQQMLQPFVQTIQDGKSGAERAQAFVPVLRFFGTALASGGAILLARAALFGMTDPGDELEDIAKAFENDDTARAWAMIAGRAHANMLAAAGYGMFGNYIQMGLDISDQQRVKNPLSPPGLAPIDSMVELVQRGLEQGKITANDMDQIAERTVSIYRATKRVTATAANEVGVEMEFGQLEQYRRDRMYVSSMVRDWADENGIANKRTIQGRIARTERSPGNTEIWQAIVVGQPERAKALIEKELEGLTRSERTRRLQSIRASLRVRQPMVIGMAPASRANKASFLEWAEKNLSPANADKVKRMMSDYDKNLKAAGL